MNINRSTRWSLALLALLSVDTLGATPPDNPTPPAYAPAAATVPAAASQQDQQPATGAPDVPPDAMPSPSQQGQATQDMPATAPSAAAVPAAAQSHKAPAAVVEQAADATPKEQAAVVAQVANPNSSSGFRLMTLSTNALLSRVSLADQAKHTIDLQYYIFNNDATGRLIALHLLQAADRGVHVRLLVDDLNITDDALMFKALDAHPNIEVRLFNPFHSAAPSGVAKTTQLLLDFRLLNRRMHNKDFIIDNEVAIIGGRNIGDGYFDAKDDNNFRDLDVIAIGPVVPAATAVFESYWSSDASHPMAEFHSGAKAPVTSSKPLPATVAAPGGATPSASNDTDTERAILQKSARTFEQSAYKEAAAADLPNGASADRPGNWYWGPATVVADQPEKIEAGADRPDLRISPEIHNLIKQAKSEVLVISPYFVPSGNDEANFIADAKRGVAFKVLTNSLASTDEVPVYNGYAEHREALLKGGVQLYELKPVLGVKMAATDANQASGVSLHAKALVVDHRYVFIGSMNMDERSKLLNTEMGVVVDSPQLAKAVAEFFRTATLPANAYHVVLGARDGSDPSGMYWEASENGKDVEYSNAPGASLGRKAKATLMRVLPIDGLL